jgi:hypothetical protein
LIQTPLAQGSSPSGHSAKTNRLRWIASKGGGEGDRREDPLERVNGTKRQYAHLFNNNSLATAAILAFFAGSLGEVTKNTLLWVSRKKLRTASMYNAQSSPLLGEIRCARLTKCLR